MPARGNDAPNTLARKQRAAAVSLLFNFVSVVFKLVAAVITGSVSLLSEGIHSGTDVFASAVAWLGIRAAAAPPDEDHPFGHGKIETLTGFGEAVMLIGIVGFIAFEAIHRLQVAQPVEQIEVGLAVMIASSIGSFLASRYVGKVGRATGSVALQSNAQHLTVDCVTSVGVLSALLVTKLTGWVYADPVFALGFACWLGYGATRMVLGAFHELIDVKLPEEDLQTVKSILDGEPELLGYHRLRSRRSGGFRDIDLHIVVPNEWNVVKAHELADRIEKRIMVALDPAHVVIHVDPYDVHKAATPPEGSQPT